MFWHLSGSVTASMLPPPPPPSHFVLLFCFNLQSVLPQWTLRQSVPVCARVCARACTRMLSCSCCRCRAIPARLARLAWHFAGSSVTCSDFTLTSCSVHPSLKLSCDMCVSFTNEENKIQLSFQSASKYPNWAYCPLDDWRDILLLSVIGLWGARSNE